MDSIEEIKKKNTYYERIIKEAETERINNVDLKESVLDFVTTLEEYTQQSIGTIKTLLTAITESDKFKLIKHKAAKK